MDGKRLRRLVACIAALSIAVAVTTGSPGRAAAQDRAKASFRFEEGKQALAKGRLDDAIAALGEAHAVLKTPATALAYARALDKKGRLAEALAVAHGGKATPKEPKESFTMMKARADLDALVQALDKRVPRLRIDGDAGTAVKIDGKEVAIEGGLVRVDPGTHAVETVKAGAATTAQITVAEGEEKSVSGAPAAQPGAAGVNPAAKDEAAPRLENGAPARPASPDDSASDRKGPGGAAVAALVGFTGFAFGAGLGIGGFLVSRARLQELEVACPDGECASYAAGEYRDASATRTVAFVAFGVAGAGLITGIVGAVVAGQSRGKAPQKSAARERETGIRVSVGATSVVVDGSF